MSEDDLKRFADDLNTHLDVAVTLDIDPDPENLHVLTIDGVEFFFYADGSGYDGWGRPCIGPSDPK
ncbi:MAG: hypothetical protein H6819_02350 [Phycisphaerales bacterium]|nr:hypothetical protein [Phycisphaerales bacterium]MCB9856946.1 hypothetical protein [Phycisphaerales bacterium]MCB9861927.1 hypothetical protein [Phycisphaerales bacterium]